MEFLLVKQIVVPVALFLCITYAFKAVLDAVDRVLLARALRQTHGHQAKASELPPLRTHASATAS